MRGAFAETSMDGTFRYRRTFGVENETATLGLQKILEGANDLKPLNESS